MNKTSIVIENQQNEVVEPIFTETVKYNGGVVQEVCVTAQGDFILISDANNSSGKMSIEIIQVNCNTFEQIALSLGYIKQEVTNAQ